MAPNEQIFIKFSFGQTEISGTLHEDLSTFLVMCLKILCGMKIVCGTRWRDKSNTFDVKYIIFKNFVYDLIIKICHHA